MQEEVQGTTLPVLEVTLDPGESVVSEAGEFSWMTETIELGTSMGKGTGGKGLMGAVKRVAGGSSFLFNTYTAQGASGMVGFAAKLPGAIMPIDVADGSGEWVCHRKGFLAGTTGIEISAALQQTFRGGIFGGEGFVLQKIAGSGRAWIELSGEVRTFDLAPGQVLRAHPGHVGLFQSSVTFAVQKVPGLMNRYMGDDGHHFVLLTGPGRVHLQSMPITILAGALQPYLEKDGGGGGSAVGGGLVGGALGGLLGR